MAHPEPPDQTRSTENPTLSPSPLPRAPIQLIQSASAATVSVVWRMGVTFATHMVLRRLIPPEQLGVWNWAEPLFLIIAQLRDLGVPGHVVRQVRRPYGNYFGIQLGWGGILSLGLLLGAPALAILFRDHDQETVRILQVMCLFLFVQGLGSVPLTYFEAEQKITRTIPAELARNLVFAGLAVTLALRGLGVWSVILAHVVAATVYTVILWYSARRDMPLTLIRGHTRELVRASLPLMVMSLLEIGVLNLDPLILGYVLPEREVAIAALAILAVYLVSRQIADAAGRAVYPALVRHHADPERAFSVFGLATIFLASLVVPAAFFHFLNAELVVLVLTLGKLTWIDAADYLRVAAFVPFVRPLTMFGRELLLVARQDRLLVAYTAGNLLSVGAVGLWLTRTELGAIGMAVASYFPLGTLLLAVGLHALSPKKFWLLLRQLVELYLLGALMFAPVLLIPEESLYLRCSVSALIGLLFLALALTRHRMAYREFLASD